MRAFIHYYYNATKNSRCFPGSRCETERMSKERKIGTYQVFIYLVQVVNFQKGSFLQPKLTFFCQNYITNRCLSRPQGYGWPPQSLHIDLRVSADPVDVRNEPQLGSYLKEFFTGSLGLKNTFWNFPACTSYIKIPKSVGWN